MAVTVDAGAGRRPISAGIYGRNNSLSDDPQKPLSSSSWRLYREAGLRMLRENGGNNSTKYHWRRKLTSHPDWYNNVYDHDWDFLARSLSDSLPGACGLLALQLLGKAAANKSNNFNDWDYNGASWWSGCAQNLAGGGTVNPDGGDSALIDGNPDLYLTDWPADSTAAILDHWFGAGGLGLDKSRFTYWNMDNEPEIWCSTHDDALPENITAEEFMQRYFRVAKSARARFPEIKLVGFVACNEWQWYAWNNAGIQISENGATRTVTWAEYFIKRVAEEQKSSGTRLLDVMDFHFYPGTSADPALTMQLHRIWFDTSWTYPKANGCKLLGGGWDEKIRKEFIMERCRRWLDRYMDAGHGVGLGVSECGSIAADDPNVVAVWYASQLGTFANHGVELFTPWEWHIGQWEVLHLFSRYCGPTRVESASSLDSVVSAYSSIGEGDSMVIVLVNRDRTNSRSASVALKGFTPNPGSHATLRLSGLPADTETFVSHEKNALVKGALPVADNAFSIDLPPLSVTAVVLAGKSDGIVPTARAAVRKRPAVWVAGGRLFVRGAAYSERLDVSLYTLRGARIGKWSAARRETAVFPLGVLPPGPYAVIVGAGRQSGLFHVVR